MPVGTDIRPVEDGREQRPVDSGFAAQGPMSPLSLRKCRASITYMASANQTRVKEGCILFLGVLIVVFLRWLGERLEGAPPPQPVEIRVGIGLGSEEGDAWVGSSREPAP